MTEHQWTDNAFITGLARMLATRTGYMEPDNIAAAVLFLCSDDAAHIHGINLSVDERLARRNLGRRVPLEPRAANSTGPFR